MTADTTNTPALKPTLANRLVALAKNAQMTRKEKINGQRNGCHRPPSLILVCNGSRKDDQNESVIVDNYACTVDSPRTQTSSACCCSLDKSNIPNYSEPGRLTPLAKSLEEYKNIEAIFDEDDDNKSMDDDNTTISSAGGGMKECRVRTGLFTWSRAQCVRQ